MADGDNRRFAPDFFHRIMAGEWEVVLSYCRIYPELISLPLTKTGDNVIHLAVSRGETDWLTDFLGIPVRVTIELRKNTEGDTPLNLAAMRGDPLMCEQLCRRGKAALTTRNKRGEAPMYLASVMGAMAAFNFLLGKFMELYSEPVPLVSWDEMSSIQRDRCNEACIRKDQDTILHAAIRGEFIDLAYKIFQQFQYLAIIKNEEGETPIHLLAKLPSSFKSGYRPGLFKRLVYHRIPENLALILIGIQNDAPASNIETAEFQTENQRSTQNDAPASNIGLAASSPMNRLTSNQILILLMLFRQHVPYLGITRWFMRRAQSCRNQMIFLLTWLRKLGTSFGILLSWFITQAQYYVVVLIFPQSVIMEKRKHILSKAMVEKTIQYLKDRPEIDQSNPWMRPRAVDAATNSDTSQQAGTSNPSGNTASTSNPPQQIPASNVGNTSQQAGTSNPLGNTASTSNTSQQIPASNIGNTSQQAGTPSNPSEAKKTNIEAPIVSAVKMGITEMVRMIVHAFPFTVDEVDGNGKNLIFVAAESRQPQVLVFLLNLNIRQTLVTERLKDGKNVLHVAAELRKDHNDPWSITSGAPLQMHLEAKWFELVKKLMPSHLQLHKNNNGEKPNEVYENCHKELVGEGLEWLSSTARSCTVISSLLTTAALATAATVPGGVSTKGVPNLRDDWRFKVFSISALVTLCFGVLSLVLFLAILSSRSDVKNFKVGLPRKLIYGFITLYASLSTLLLAFCFAQSFAIDGKVRYAAYASYALLASSIIYIVYEQLPLSFDFIGITSAKLQNWSNS